MAYINTYLQLYAAIVMVIMLVGNLFGKYHMDSCRKLFYDLLGFDIVMLLAGSADNYVLIRLGDETGMLMHAVFAGISDFSYFMVLGLFTLYVDIYAKGGKGRADGIAYVGAAVALAYGIFWFVSDFWGIIYTQNAVALTFGPLYVAGQVGGYVAGLIAILILFRYRRIYTLGEKIGFALFVFIPLLGSIFKYVFSDIILMPLLVTISIIIIQYFIQISRELVYSRQQTEMAKMQTDLLLSRMKPHFIYNVLNTIYALCDSSAEQAKKAIVAFSQYLRKSLVDIDSHELITFEDELNHVENYLMIEKLRFADQLEIEYDIREKDFLVPPLALQAVVENAVRHGIEKKPGGGRLLISTYRAEGAWHIMVKDTGAGFDAGPDIASITEGKDGRKHVGLYSASARLKELCKGSLTIKSRPG
ncbi:MAG: histidine kinase [Lachnospiraceae bacterium]|nr:histidine kinase [Lachnospiraceae bacterium]